MRFTSFHVTYNIIIMMIEVKIYSHLYNSKTCFLFKRKEINPIVGDYNSYTILNKLS